MAKLIDKELVIRELIKLRYEKFYSIQSLVFYLKDTYTLENSRAYELVREMRARIGELYENTNTFTEADAIETLERLKEESVKDGDKKLALEIQKEINKVKQLHIQKIEVDAKNIENITIQIKKNDDI